MSSAERNLSNVIPVLVASLVCDVAVADPSTGKKNLIGIFDKILASKVPVRRPICLYLKLTDAEGDYNLEVKVVQVSTSKVLAGATGEMKSGNRLESPDLYILFPPIEFAVIGRYEFQIWANSVYLGGTFLDVVLRDLKKE
ncbi:MAG: hypothetical protein ABSG90_02400 [Dehalococcoidia bacterium]|jgi:hypothetical protein